MADGGNYSFEIERSCGVISERSGGWKKELNLVFWNGRTAKYDIRDWNPDHDRPGKGITLSEDDLRALGKLIDEEVARLDDEEKHPATHIKEDLKTEKSGQKAFEFTRDNPDKKISDFIDYDEL